MAEKSFVRFIVVGIFVNLVNFIVTAVLTLVTVNSYLSGLTGFWLGAIISYIYNSCYTFNSPYLGKVKILKYLLLQAVLSNCYSALIHLFSSSSTYKAISILLALIIVVPTNYAFQRFVIFNNHI